MALQVGSLAEVVSTDRPTGKPWFQGRLDYAPPVFDFRGRGLPADRRAHRARAPQRGGHAGVFHATATWSTVFGWPGTAGSAPVRTACSGFNVMHWSDASMQYWIVCDLDS